MGYIYGTHGLCCDVCGGDYAHKNKCPYGYCQAIALCAKCKAKHPEYLTKKYHEENMRCGTNHSRFVAQKLDQQAILDSGQELRISALGHDSRLKLNVKVIFQRKDGTETAYWMALDTYHSIPLLTPATPDDYRKFGDVEQANNIDIYDIELEVIK